MDQRICIKFCLKNGIKCSTAYEMLTAAFGESTISKGRAYTWYKRLKDGREEVENDDRPGRPTTSTIDDNVEQVKEMIMNNHRITIREVSSDVGISFGSCQTIITDILSMKRVAGKFVPKLQSFDQKERRVDIAKELLNEVYKDPELLKRIITGDETWLCEYDIETKGPSCQQEPIEEPKPKKFRQLRSNLKVLLTVYFDYNGIVHYEFLPQGRMANKDYYLEVMSRLHEAIREKRPELWENNSWKLHQDNNAPSHTPLIVREFLAKNNTIMLPQSPYSPDIAPADFFLFPKLKRNLKSRCFTNIDEMKTEFAKELNAIPKNEFQKCFKDLKKRLEKCILYEGDYFEGDIIDE